ncbi:MAG: prepilin-type N-terminal cleavage/methylation domain-containing protein [Ignavibacteriales bacterium]|nr:prepilin-type N-terminal cleavage/methylation domain-containing protein [Ignavibacteriales bacterium]
MKKKSVGFTLAEILITLTIIGIVATLTIPALQRAYEKQQIVTSLQTVVTTGNAALKQMAADKGCIDDLHCTGVFERGAKTPVNHTKDVGDELVKYFNVAKNCSNTTNMDCWAASFNNNFDGSGGNTTTVNSSNQIYKFITANGMAYRFVPQSSCNNNKSNNKTGHMKQMCGTLYVDINGPIKGPNYLGRDIFAFFITNGKGALLYPSGRVRLFRLI